MNYVVYEVATTRYAGRKAGYDDPIFANPGAAKRHIGRLIKSGKYRRAELAFASLTLFKNQIEKQVTRTNLMTGKEYSESINTPLGCSPASETYWSM